MKPRDSLEAHAPRFAPRHKRRDRRASKLNLLIEPSLARRLARGRSHQPFEAVYLTAASARGSPHPPYTPPSNNRCRRPQPCTRLPPRSFPVSAPHTRPPHVERAARPVTAPSKEPPGLTSVLRHKTQMVKVSSFPSFIAKRWGSPRQRPSRPAPPLLSKLPAVCVPSSDGICVLFSG